ncbi:hypothetical protein CWI84_05310 [Idiomarina tyrosinivorans]|uniref:Outer-membrane lipoprotein LolB n=1 Tax=Idiomarina tyrosinivorans TaxID=1445662 RepID=A0A432ZRM1_9GAMM|nr:outer membrane lipoprotein LolB [Idiomarina tyrosinivorans]RUO80476.1 hypothetical protein CWI84_05310 [Idiomarina tyrosinivorans]
MMSASGNHRQRRLRAVFNVVLVLMLGACSSFIDPSNRSTENWIGSNNPQAIAHQKQLANLNHWQAQGQLAIINRLTGERDGLYFNWDSEPNNTLITFSHPLQGVLATLTISPQRAIWWDEENGKISAPNADNLVAGLLRTEIPFSLLQKAFTGALPSGVEQVKTYDDGTLARATWRSPSQQLWALDWQAYQPVQFAQQSWQLPAQLVVASEKVKIKVRMTEWQP